LVKCLFHAATSYGIKYILDGHSFRTEGIAPLGWSYMDGRYIRSVHKAHGTARLRTYPLLGLADQVWYGLKGIKRPRPLYYIDYNSDYVRTFLEKEYGWKWYGGHHLENTYTAFFDYYYRFNKLGYDGRKVEYSALIRSGQMNREDALNLLKEPILTKEQQDNILSEIKERLGLTGDVFARIMNPIYRMTKDDWPTYRIHFKLLKPLFWAMAKTKRIPDSFYLKYCKGV
jgi:hypothetical protein